MALNDKSNKYYLQTEKNTEGKEDSNYGRTNRPMEQLLQLLQFVVASNIYENNYNEKSTQRRRKHCKLIVVRRSQKFSPRCRPPSWGAGRPKFNQLEMVTTFTHKPSLPRIDAHNFELLW